MPERGDRYFHIPVMSSSRCKAKSHRTINVTSGVKAVICKPGDSDKTRIQKYLLSVKKFKTLEKAKAWVRKHHSGKKKQKKKQKREFITDEIKIKSVFGGTNRLRYNLRIKSFDTANRIARLSPSNDDVDSGKERVMPPALHKMANKINSGQRTTIFLHHDYTKGVGKAFDAEVINDKRLEFYVYISRTEEDTWIKIQEGVLDGASIGYIPRKIVENVWYEEKGFSVNEIHDLDYYETSLVFLPMNETAGVIQVIE